MGLHGLLQGQLYLFCLLIPPHEVMVPMKNPLDKKSYGSPVESTELKCFGIGRNKWQVLVKTVKTHQNV
jgi:hypothetical protein